MFSESDIIPYNFVFKCTSDLLWLDKIRYDTVLILKIWFNILYNMIHFRILRLNQYMTKIVLESGVKSCEFVMFCFWQMNLFKLIRDDNQQNPSGSCGWNWRLTPCAAVFWTHKCSAFVLVIHADLSRLQWSAGISRDEAVWVRINVPSGSVAKYQIERMGCGKAVCDIKGSMAFVLCELKGHVE